MKYWHCSRQIIALGNGDLTSTDHQAVISQGSVNSTYLYVPLLAHHSRWFRAILPWSYNLASPSDPLWLAGSLQDNELQETIPAFEGHTGERARVTGFERGRVYLEDIKEAPTHYHEDTEVQHVLLNDIFSCLLSSLWHRAGLHLPFRHNYYFILIFFPQLSGAFERSWIAGSLGGRNLLVTWLETIHKRPLRVVYYPRFQLPSVEQ